jgi:hypothetical protein
MPGEGADVGAMRRPRRLVAGALVAAAALLSGHSLEAELAASLSPKDIRDAIAWGMQGEPAPYSLHHRSYDPGKQNPVIVGVVYTPFVRVALAAKKAHDAFREFGDEDLTPTLVEPLAYVAMRWYCCDADHGADLASHHPLVPFDYKIAVAGSDRFSESLIRMDTLRIVPPVWVKRAASVLADLGGSLPYSDTVVVAAYPVADITAGTDFIIYRDHLTPDANGYPTRNVRDVRDGRVTAADLALWR